MKKPRMSSMRFIMSYSSARIIIGAFLAMLNVTNAVVEISLGSLCTRQYGLAGDVVAISNRVLEIRDFSYDGPPAYFWADTNSTPSIHGFRLQDGAPTQSCGVLPITSATGHIGIYRIEFPKGTSLLDIRGGSISLWSEKLTYNFGEVVVVPDDLPGLDVSDQTELVCTDRHPITGAIPDIVKTPNGFSCAPLDEFFQVRWAVDDLQREITIELVAWVDQTSYMSFGPSGLHGRTQMIGSDVVIADMFKGEFRATDFYMSARYECSDVDGVCPDVDAKFHNGVYNVSGKRESGITAIRYTRPLVPVDVDMSVKAVAVDRSISVIPGKLTFVSWAIGPVHPDTGLPAFHSIAFAYDDVAIEFGQAVVDRCSPLLRPLDEGEQTHPPDIEPFVRPEINGEIVFTARIGPSGGDKGVIAITKQETSGVAWYINDLLIPEITLKRGTTYTFRVNGGEDEHELSDYHPFYLTTSITGGFSQLSPSERLDEMILAGLVITKEDVNGIYEFVIQAAGPLCQYKVTEATEHALSGTFEEYFKLLDTSCANDKRIIDGAAILTFTPTKETPDSMYYQCVTQKNMGWKIRVVDEELFVDETDDISDAG